MVRALVLGATGHIGAHIVRALLAGGHQVRAAYRRPQFLSVLEGLPIERVALDLDDAPRLRAALEGCEWVFHAAGYYPSFTAPRRRAVQQSIESTRRVLEALTAAAPRRIVFTSSAATIQRVAGRAATEADAEPWPLRDRRPLYATVKIAMEAEVRRACRTGLPVVIVNPSVCLGEYDAHPFSGRAILAFAKHRLPCYYGHEFNAVYTGDVGVGHVRAAERGRIGERYLLTGHQVTVKDFAALVATAAGVPPPRWRVPYPAMWAASMATEAAAWLTRREPLLPRQVVYTARLGQRLDGAKAIRELSLPQTPLEEAIRRALAWFASHYYL